jgi:hypothetical protein
VWGMTKSYVVHLADHAKIEENGGAFALCAEWVTTPDDKRMATTCRPCLRREKKERRSGRVTYDPDSLYDDPDDDDFGDSGTGMMRG